MNEDRNTAEWWADGWARAYEGRANFYFGPMPEDEQKRMLYARDRMDAAFEREQEWRRNRDVSNIR